MFIFGVIFALVAGILFGLIGPTTKIAYNSGASVALTIFLRYAVASIIILPFIPYQNNLLEIFKKFLNNTVPTSAIPNGIPGCPEFAFSTDEAERTLMDLVTLSNTD